MVLKKTNSRVYIINLFSDFLLTKISHTEESIFSVVDCNNFVIIKGKTTHKEILDISSITKEFNEKYEPSKPISHTIALATDIIFLKAICMFCKSKDTKPVDAVYTVRIIQEKKIELIGSNDIYKASCLDCMIKYKLSQTDSEE